MDEEEDWGFLLIDASNIFNKLNWTAMLWHAYGTSGPLENNTYSIAIIIGAVDGASSTFIHSKEGVTQGNALSIVIYGNRALPLICRLKREFPGVK
jgi:hypothetical protein